MALRVGRCKLFPTPRIPCSAVMATRALEGFSGWSIAVKASSRPINSRGTRIGMFDKASFPGNATVALVEVSGDAPP
jgi:hypothetical protein